MVRGVEIRRVLRTGRRSRRSFLDIFWQASEADQPRFGLVVPRAGESAVARNRLRRRLKELWRRELVGTVGQVDMVVRTSKASYRVSFSELRRELMSWAADVSK